MDKREIDKIAFQIRNGKNIVKNIRCLDDQISILRFNAFRGQKEKTLEDTVVKWLHQEANYIEREFYHALNSFIEESNPNPPKNRKVCFD